MVTSPTFHSEMVAQNIHRIYFGGNWADMSISEVIKDITWQEASKQWQHSATISTLSYHIHYFAKVTLDAIISGKLHAKDSESWKSDHINSPESWEELKAQILDTGQKLSDAINTMQDHQLHGNMDDPKYGSVYHNVQGIMEHHHYHLGQIVHLKKLYQLNSNG